MHHRFHRNGRLIPHFKLAHLALEELVERVGEGKVGRPLTEFWLKQKKIPEHGSRHGAFQMWTWFLDTRNWLVQKGVRTMLMDYDEDHGVYYIAPSIDEHLENENEEYLRALSKLDPFTGDYTPPPRVEEEEEEEELQSFAPPRVFQLDAAQMQENEEFLYGLMGIDWDYLEEDSSSLASVGGGYDLFNFNLLFSDPMDEGVEEEMSSPTLGDAEVAETRDSLGSPRGSGTSVEIESASSGSGVSGSGSSGINGS
ncbi:hypothetical protein BT69DRAFT_334297 [Atractiella rhizophila]|nr:hypothetical protein BT69DRAFT_334297 [Atractiella rhizophila]